TAFPILFATYSLFPVPEKYKITFLSSFHSLLLPTRLQLSCNDQIPVNGTFYFSVPFQIILHFKKISHAFFNRKAREFPFYHMRKPYKRAYVIEHNRTVCLFCPKNLESCILKSLSPLFQVQMRKRFRRPRKYLLYQIPVIVTAYLFCNKNTSAL